MKPTPLAETNHVTPAVILSKKQLFKSSYYKYTFSKKKFKE
jgi:hypothetical protein